MSSSLNSSATRIHSVGVDTTFLLRNTSKSLPSTIEVPYRSAPQKKASKSKTPFFNAQLTSQSSELTISVRVAKESRLKKHSKVKSSMDN